MREVWGELRGVGLAGPTASHRGGDPLRSLAALRIPLHAGKRDPHHPPPPSKAAASAAAAASRTPPIATPENCKASNNRSPGPIGEMSVA
ncbi:hypothetical protein DFJ73DRAFT_786735 [Zopfochytrium polystomum]|nr:hypothetical protein DFJ73DRAFT_786735 [Zopfochytrium polystomum]